MKTENMLTIAIYIMSFIHMIIGIVALMDNLLGGVIFIIFSLIGFVVNIVNINKGVSK